jgi:transcriptional regulator with XRE-family HTH domain
MSNFGKNIRKIRTVKKLSQAEFADLFELNRGNISAYEEERSEAKIETIIAIANYFSISIDDLLTKELTIDDIYHLDKIRKNYSLLEKSKLTGQIIPYFTKQKLGLFYTYYSDATFIENLSSLQVPNINEENILGVEVNRQMASKYWNIEPEDILIITRNATEIENSQNKLYLQVDKYKFDIVHTNQGANKQSIFFEIIGLIKVKIDSFYNQLINRIEQLENLK